MVPGLYLRHQAGRIHGRLAGRLGGHSTVEKAPALAVQVTEVIGLQPIGQHAEEEMPGQVRGRLPPEHVPPPGTKRANVEIAQARDLDIERLLVRCCRTDFYAWHVGQAARRLDAAEALGGCIRLRCGRYDCHRTFSEFSFNFSFLRTTPARKPRTECCCQPVACIIAAIVVPAGDCSIAITRRLLGGRLGLLSSVGANISRVRRLCRRGSRHAWTWRCGSLRAFWQAFASGSPFGS